MLDNEQAVDKIVEAIDRLTAAVNRFTNAFAGDFSDDNYTN